MTERTEQVLEFIRASMGANGFPPSVQEIADHFGVAKSTAYYDLRRLLADGAITTIPRTARSAVPMKAPEVTM
jgi:Mn-dependent DtxR family transcriptional regulator